MLLSKTEFSNKYSFVLIKDVQTHSIIYYLSTEILKHASLENTSTKKVIQKLEKKLGADLSSKKKMIDQIVMDIVNNMESEDEEMDESSDEEPKKKPPPKKVKKEEEDDDDEERDDSNDSDWGVSRVHLRVWSCMTY